MMQTELLNTSNGVAKKVTRDDIIGFEGYLKGQPNVMLNDCFPLKHTFSDGIYVREIFIPAGSELTGKIHLHEHPNFLVQGVVRVATEFGVETLVAPVSIISKPGTKRALHAITDVRWITIHLNPTNTQDLEKLEKQIIAPSYEAYEKHKLKLENKAMKKLKNKGGNK